MTKILLIVIALACMLIVNNAFSFNRIGSRLTFQLLAQTNVNMPALR
jgi:hypothetical protein